MARRNGIVYGAVVAASALVLTACGGDGDSAEDDEIAGVQTPTEESEPEQTEDPEPTEDPEAGRPEIDLGPDFENVYEVEPTGDAVVDAALLDLRGFQDAVAEAVVTHENDRPALSYYVTGEALSQVFSTLEYVFETGNSSGGTTRYYNMNVTPVDDVSATFSFCRDFTEVYTIDLATGEVVEEADPNAVPDYYFGRLELNDAGVWQTVAYDLESGNPSC
ncbi:hypothetical protein FH609_027225 [Streptomyces sp. 3MP-14]|uniref:Lipoprotein n=1 Tax=Streptomyces mimosae TaxID=2586635 RepID=A0A5N5ZXY1_9ACTN|nr:MULTISPECIES: hypothetical protein [Streptomyces]KAB8161381.1 hypothetical protein FH607_025170 [Streptomyces mimosae]KAB8173295.1 hypothetical protein FH609_027225 [Streptomyces sp. 3MP-14]